VYLMALLALVLESCGLVLFGVYDLFIIAFFFIDSLLILLSALVIRFRIIAPAALTAIILATDELKNSTGSTRPLKPARFYNFMPVAMVCNFIAGPVIYYNPPAGAMVYLVAHLFHIFAFSGLIHIQPRALYSRALRRLAVASTIGWAAAAAVIYPALLFLSPTGVTEFKLVMALVLIPYVIILSFATLLTYIASGYSKRPRRFRLMLAGGMTVFLFSDSTIGYSIFVEASRLTTLLIYPTYLLAIFLLQFAVLELQSFISNRQER